MPVYFFQVARGEPKDPLTARVAKYKSARKQLKKALGRRRGRPRRGEVNEGRLPARKIDNLAAKEAGFYDREEARRATHIVEHRPDLTERVDRRRTTIRAAYLQLKRDSGVAGKRRRKASAETVEKYVEARVVLGREQARVSRGIERMSEDRLSDLVQEMERCIASAQAAWFNRVPFRQPL